MLQQIKNCAKWCTRRASRTKFVTYIRDNPFSTMAVCNIAGDSGYLGYALYSGHGTSLLQLGGALSALAGHTMLLAYGDSQLAKAEHETGRTAAITAQARAAAKRLTGFIVRKKEIPHPIACAFGLLTLNGVSLTGAAGAAAVAASRLTFTSGAQCLLGATVIVGCGAFAAADMVKTQRAANILTTIAPCAFTGSMLSAIALTGATWNPFISISTAIFALSNFATYFAKFKKPPLTTGPSL